ncbi:hypothetical protein Esti_000827 [Eimeria stiedai]
MVYLRSLEKTLWGTAISVILSRFTVEAKIGGKVPMVPVDVSRLGPKPPGDQFSVEVPVLSDAKTIRTSVDAILEGLEIFRPGEKQLRRASTYDEVQPLRTNTPEANLKNLKSSLGSQWLSDVSIASNCYLFDAEEGTQSCKEAKALAEECPASQGPLSPLSCSMREIDQAKEAAIGVEAAILGSTGDAQPRCSKVLTKLLHYLDLSVFNTPFVLYQQGASPARALDKAFAHWGLSIRDGESGSSSASAADDAPPSHVELRSRRITSSTQGPVLEAVGEQKLKEPVDVKDVLFHGLTASVLRVNPRAQIFFAAGYNPTLKAGLMLLLLAHLRYDELFGKSSQSRTARIFPSVITFLSSSIASQRRQADSLCQVKLKKIRDLPKLPQGYRFIPRLFMIRKVFGTGHPKLACDLLDDAINNTKANYERGLAYFNEVMTHLPVEKRRRTILLQKNTSPAINLKRLCFSLSAQPEADILDKATPCSLNDLHLPRDQRETPSFLQAEREAISKPEATAEASSPPDKNALEFYFDLISNMGECVSGCTVASVGSVSITLAESDYPLTKDPRTHDEIVAATQKNAARCGAVDAKAFNKELAKQGLETPMEFAQKCSGAKSSQSWISWKCERFLIDVHCDYFEGTRAALNNGEEIMRTLGWLARQEPCAGHHCADWKKLHPYNVMMTCPRFYAMLSVYSPWIRMMLVFNEWYGLYDLSAKHIQTADAVYNLNGFQASYMVEGRRDKKGLLQKLLGLSKTKQQLTTMHVRFLMSQLSPEAMFALQSAFRPVVHHSTLHLLNQYAAFMSEPNGELKDKGGNFQEKKRQGLSPTTEDFKGFSLTGAPPDTNDFNRSVKTEILTAIETLSYQPELQEEFWLSCQNPSRASNSIQLLRDSHHLLTQAGDDLLLVGIVINPQQTTAGLHKNLLDRLLKAVNRAVDKLLRFPTYVLQHATYTVIVPDYARVALVVKELAQVYSRNPSVFKDVDVFREAVGFMLDILQNDFFSPTGLPPSVPVTALLNNVDPFYNMMGATERAAEFRRSIMANFFAHIWKLVMNLSLDSMVNPKKVQKREKQYSQPSWQRAMMDPFQSNSMRMVIAGGDLGFTVFDKVLSRDQKRMLKSVRFGTGIMFSHNMLLAGRVHAELGYVSYGNFITAQSPFLGKVVIDWLEKRKNDRVREILGWISLALFFAGTVIEIVNQLNTVATQEAGALFAPEAGDVVANQSGLSRAGGCGPMGLCLDTDLARQAASVEGVDSVLLSEYAPEGVVVSNVPDMSASPVLTAVSIVIRTVVMVGMSSILGPFVSFYAILSSHWKFLQRLEQVVGNLFKWIVYNLRRGKFGRWYMNLRETRQAKREAKRLAELGRKQEKQGSDDESLGELEGDTDIPKESLAWGDMFEAPSQPKKKQFKGKRLVERLFKWSKRKNDPKK